MDEFEIFFKKNNFSITNKIFNDKDLTEINVYYKNKNILDKEFILKKEFNRRFIYRIVNGKITLKDMIFSKYIKFFMILNLNN